MALTPRQRLTNDRELPELVEACRNGSMLRFCAMCGSDDDTFKSMIEVGTDKPVYLTDEEKGIIQEQMKQNKYEASHGYCTLCAGIVRYDLKKVKGMKEGV